MPSSAIDPFGMAFAVSGCLDKGNRFRHLFLVAVVAWLRTFLYVVFGVITPERWMFTLLAILAMMGIGGGPSYLFVGPPPGVDWKRTLPLSEQGAQRS